MLQNYNFVVNYVLHNLVSEKIIEIIFKNSLLSHRKHCCSIMKTSWLMMLREIFAPYCESSVKLTYILGKMQSF
jgi:hypothetical protein